MHSLAFPQVPETLRLLCLGAHSDDIEIGCGGTILRFLSERDVIIRWIVFSANQERALEAASSAAEYFNGQSEIHHFRDGYFPYEGSEIKGVFEKLKEFNPHLILTHTRHDRHQDHRLISDLTWNTFRNHLIWEYEIPKYDADLGSPNHYVTLSPQIVEQKINMLLAHFKSQTSKRWFTEETFRSILRIRGIESASETGYAEAFYVRKSVM